MEGGKCTVSAAPAHRRQGKGSAEGVDGGNWWRMQAQVFSHRLNSKAYTSKCARPPLFGCSHKEAKASVQQLAGGEGQRVLEGDKSCVNEWVPALD